MFSGGVQKKTQELLALKIKGKIFTKFLYLKRRRA